jgi:hypothetical protein
MSPLVGHLPLGNGERCRIVVAFTTTLEFLGVLGLLSDGAEKELGQVVRFS